MMLNEYDNYNNYNYTDLLNDKIIYIILFYLFV